MKNNKKLVQWIIIAVAFVAIKLIPTNELWTPILGTYLAITVSGILLLAFNLLNNVTSSIILMFAYPLAKVCTLTQALSNWTSQAIWMTLCCFVLVVLIQKTTILERIAYSIAAKCKGNYVALVLAIAGISFIARILMQGILALVSVIAIVYGMCKALGLKGKAAAGLLLVCTFVYHDANHFLYSAGYFTIVLSNAQAVVPELTSSYPAFFADNWVFIIPLIITTVVVALMCKPKEGLAATDFFDQKLKELGPWTPKDKKMMVILAIFIVLLFTDSIHHLGMMYAFVFVITAPFLPGIDIGEASDFNKVSWGGIFFVAACMTIGTAGAAAGFGKFISTVTFPVLQNVSGKTFLSLTYFLSVALNFIMTPAAVMSVMGEPLAQVCLTLGFSPMAMCYVVFQGISQLLFSYEVTVYMVAFSFGLFDTKEFAIPMFVKFVIQTVALLTIGFLWWGVRGLI
ncbi:MAG: SLC13 family permease [Erysipelotrichaceae bacterium]|nr:SLC13 family permease [Erysipelotrichaceae bacterium]